jgi:uncharacterized tellurite resistance protein B-like protein
MIAMMIKRVIDFLSGRDAPSPAKGADDFQLAVAALLIEAARMDDDFTESERATIGRLLANKFDLTPPALEKLMHAAEEKVQKSTQLFSFTHQVNKTLPPESRAHIIEMLWQVAYTDGVLDANEDMLIRRIAGLIHVPDRERANARAAALEKLAASKKS